MFNWFTKRAAATPEPIWVAGPSGMLITGQDGFLGGTHVVSNLGWRRVEDLRVGDKVLTFDNGMRPILELQRETLCLDEAPMPRGQWPLLVPEGVVQNRRALHVLPDQGIFIETELVSDAQGDPYAVIPAAALIGYRGVEPVQPMGVLTINTLSFAQDEVVYAEGGMLTHCPCARSLMEAPEEPIYQVLDLEEARDLVAGMAALEGGMALGWRDCEVQEVRAHRPMRPVN